MLKYKKMGIYSLYFRFHPSLLYSFQHKNR